MASETGVNTELGVIVTDLCRLFMTSHGGQFKRTVLCAHFFENWSKKKNKRTFSHDVGPLKDNNPTCLFNSVGDKTRLLLHSLLEGESIQIMVGKKHMQHTKKSNMTIFLYTVKRVEEKVFFLLIF